MLRFDARENGGFYFFIALSLQIILGMLFIHLEGLGSHMYWWMIILTFIFFLMG